MRAADDGSRHLMRLAAGAYAVLALAPLGWTFGAAVLARRAELLELFSALPAWWALGRSAALGAAASVGSLMLALPLAFFTGRTDVGCRRLLSLLALVPLALPPYVVALGLRSTLRPWPLLGASLVLALSLYPIAYIFLRAGLANVDPSLEEAGFLSRGRAATLRRITWPLLLPWAAAASGMIFLLGLGEFGVPALLGLPVYPGVIAVRFAATYDAAGAAVAAVPLLLVLLSVLVAGRKRFSGGIELASRLRDVRPLELGRLRHVGTLSCWAILVASPGLPVLALLLQVDRDALGEALRIASRPALTSLLVAGGGLVLAMLAGLAFALRARAGAGIGGVLTPALFVLPGTVLGVGLIGFWNRPEWPYLYGTVALVALALGLRYSVVIHWALGAGLRQVSRSQEEVAWLCGRTEGAIMRTILLPQLRPALVAGSLGFILFTLRDLDTVVTIYPPGGQTLAVRLYTLLANAPEALQASLALVQVALTASVAAGVGFVARRASWLR